MATQGRNRGEAAASEIEKNLGAEQQIRHEGPSFDVAPAVEIAPVETGGEVGSFVDNAVAGVQRTPARAASPEPVRRMAEAASMAVDTQTRQSGIQQPSVVRPAANVPAVPQDAGLTPGVSSGRVSQAGGGGGYAQRQAGPQLASSELQDAGYTAPDQRGQQRRPSQVSERQDEKISSEMQKQQHARQIYQEDMGREAIREAGSFEAPKPLNVFSRANRRFKESKKFLQEKISTALKGERYHGSHGNAFSDTIISLSTIMPHEVSIGTENLREALREPNSSLLDIVNQATGLQLDVESCLADISILMNAINTSEIEVVFGKYPVNTKHSIQVRTLHVHQGRGIALHPTQTKAYNADFDGDTGNVNLDQSNLRNYSRAMTHLIDSDGQASIDPDFFPLDYMAMPSSKERQDLIDSMQERSFAWEPSVATRIADAYINACNDGDWIGLLRKIDQIAGSEELQSSTGLHQNQLTSRILKSIYDYAIDRRGLNLRLEWANIADTYTYVDPGPDAHPAVMSLIDMVEEISQGRPAMNFQDFTLYFNKQFGDLASYDADGNVVMKTEKGKNVPFRLLADFAKAIKRTDLITVGDATWGIDARGNKGEAMVTMYDLWQFTCSAGVSKLISGRMYMGSHELAVSTHIKTSILKTVPVPRYWHAGEPDANGRMISKDEAIKRNGQIFRDWIRRFQREYNSQMRMLNVSQIRFRGGMMPVRTNEKGKNLLRYDGFENIDDKCAKALVEVYGDMTVERVFPDSVLAYGRKAAGNRENTNAGVINRYGKMSLAEFAVQNRLDWYSEGVDIKKTDAIKARIDTSKALPNRDRFVPMDILMLVADRRSKQFGDYGKSWMEATKQHADIMLRIKRDIDADNFNEYANDMLEFLHLISPRMFDHFGMDSPITFAKSKWGKRLIAARNVDEFRSILVSMTIEYRFGTASNIQKKIDELAADPIPHENNANRIADMDAHYMQELRALSSSSLAWESIVSETIGDTNAFRTLLKDKVIKRGRHEYKMDAAKFWNGNTTETQYSLINFLKSSADYETKIGVLCDVIKFNTGIEAVDKSHIMGMLAHNPDPLFAGSRFEMDSGIRSATDSVKDSIDKITSYKSKTPEKIWKQASKVIEMAFEDKAVFEWKLHRFATEPGYYVHVDSVFAADAISSIYEKAYPDSEKIKQQTLVNGYFECVSLQRSGGFYTHLQQTDNGVVNVVGFDQLTNLDIVRILGDPAIVLHSYDEFGNPCEISRRALCGGDTIDDVLRYMQRHPRVALACRRHIVGINADVSGSARLSILDDDRAGVSYSNKVFSLLNDRPRFLAIAALITPAKDNVGRNLAERVNENIKTLSLFIMNEVALDKDANQVARDVEKTFGITREKFMELRMEGSFDPTDETEIDRVAAENLASQVIQEFQDCVDIVRKSGMAVRTVPDSQFDMDKIGIDKSSMLAYYDARQQLNGARTAKMIGIEGAETKKNLMLKEFVRNRADRFMTITEDTSRADILRLSELTQSDIQAELDASGEEGKRRIVIEVPDGWSAEDQTLEHGRRNQIGSIAKFLEIKREKGAETFNAKSKKYGDDGSNSIIKFFKYGTKAMIGRYGKVDKHWTVEQGDELRKHIEATGSKEAAIPILAEALAQADARLGYIDTEDVFQLSDYYNRADLMLTEYEGQVYIRTLEQLAVAFRNRLSDEAVDSGDANVVLAELAQLAEVVGTPADPMYNPGVNETLVDSVRVTSGIGSVARFERALRPYSSSTERNFTLIWNLFREFGKDEFGDVVYRMPSRGDIDRHSNEMYAKLKDNPIAEAALKGIAYPNDKWGHGEQVENEEGKRDYVYDYLGRPTDDDFFLIPGPQSLVYFEQNDAETLEKCKKYGITAAFSDFSEIPSDYINDAIVLDKGVIILPFFDMRLNGAASEPISPAPGQFFFQRNNVVVADEDTTFEIKPGDATGHATQEGLDKVHINQEGDLMIDVFDLFPNVLREKIAKGQDGKIAKNQYIDQQFTMRLATREEVEDLVLTGMAEVDYGMLEGMPGFEREVERYYLRLEEYADRFHRNEVDENSFISEDDCHYDSIVGFVKLQWGNNKVFAPIIPFHHDDGTRAPEKFKMESMDIDYDSYSYHMRWKFTGDIRDQYIKFFEGIGASNKLMVYGDPVRSRILANGTPIDIMYSTSSVSSRLFPVNKRIHTMISLMMIPRIDPTYSYNFGEMPGAFPVNPEIRDGLRMGTLTLKDWADIVRDNPNLRYHDDEEINGIVKWFVEKCVHPERGFQTVNPSILLSTHIVDADGNRQLMNPVGTEFEAFMDSGYNFQNALMKFMNKMNPTLVPANINDNSESTLFKPVNKTRDDENYGVLQMMVPHWTPDTGEYYEVAENVYLSFAFFGDEFSGFKKVNYDAANRGLDDLNVSNNLDGFDLSQVMAFGRAGFSSVPSMNMMEVAQDNIMREVDNQPIQLVHGDLSRILSKKIYGRTLALTGHRPNKLWGYDLSNERYQQVAEQLAEYCRKHNVDTIISGMALGFDQLGAQVAIDNGLKFVAAIPMEGQESKWPKESQERYHELLGYADKVVYVNDGEYSAAKMNMRNEWMVNNADAVFALHDGSSGGTGNAVKYAERQNKLSKVVNPKKDIK